MAKYQQFLSRIGSNRDRAALRGIFSQFLTDGDPPALKDLVLASIILSGTETTQITISGANTTGILLSGTSSADGISLTGVCADGIHISGANTVSGLHISGNQVDCILIDVSAAADNGLKILVDDGITLGVGLNIDRTGTTGICTIGISIDTDGTTGIEIAAGFTGVNMISLAGTGSTSGILISGACAIPLNITGAFTTGLTIAADGTTAISVTSAFTGVTGLSFAGTASGDGILISGACADGIHISGTNTASGLHISGDQVSSILIDVDAAVDNVMSVSVDDDITATVGINIARTGTTGICTTGIMIDTDGTTALWIGTGFTGTTGILLAGTATNAISITGACTTAINIAKTTAKTAIRIGEWAASQAAGSAVVFATNMAGVDTSQLNIIAAFGESVADLTSAYSSSVLRGRHLVSAASDTVFTHEVYGVMGQVVCKNASFNHYASGVMGTFEASNTLTHVMSGYVAAAVTGRLGGAVLTCESGGLVAGVAAINNSSAHTATGVIAGFATHKTAAGIAWPIGLYMAAGDVTKGIDITCSAIGATGRIAKLAGTMATGNLGDGYGALEIDVTSSGAVAGTIAASSTWLNFAAESVPGGNIICCQNNGIYLPSGITASSAKMIMGMRMQYVADDGANPGSLFCFSTNIFSNVLTAIFDVNAIVDLGGASGAQTGNDYKIPLFKDASAGQVWYVNVYHT